MTSNNSQLTVQGTDLFATTTTLSFNYADTLAGRLAFSNSNENVQFITAGYLSDPTGYLALESNVPLVYQYGSELGDQVIASALAVSAVPEPPALPLLATGLGMMGLLAWRRKRKATTQAAA